MCLYTPTCMPSSDHIVSVDSVHYEMPSGYSGSHEILYRHVLDDSLTFLHQGRLVDLAPVDLAANARARRARGDRSDEDDTARPLPKSAADLIYERDLGPVVGPDGGLIVNPKNDNQEEEES